MPTLAITNFNIVVSVLGGWITLFGLVSYFCKETLYLSEALASLLAGVAFSPSAANFIRPLEYAGSQDNLNFITLCFSRLVLGVQLVLAGVQLPSRYPLAEWKSLVLLVAPVMTCMWLATSLLIFAFVPNIPFVHALAVGACVTPTDPILSNVIVKGKFADRNIPEELHLIIAESGANGGLGYPFLLFALCLIQYNGVAGTRQDGAAVGWLARNLLWWAEQRKYVDRESFLVFAVTLALFIVGTCGMIGSDDVLACFIAGNTFTWDDWFRLETTDDSLQPTINMLLNVTIFMWYGAVCPWSGFLFNSVVPVYRLISLGVCVLLFRRLPWVVALHKAIHQIEGIRQAVFVGFFGPIGVSAIFYLYITLEFLARLDEGGRSRNDVTNLGEIAHVVVWFLAICSIVLHGLSVPLGKLGYLSVTLSHGLSIQNGDDEPALAPRSARNFRNATGNTTGATSPDQSSSTPTGLDVRCPELPNDRAGTMSRTTEQNVKRAE